MELRTRYHVEQVSFGLYPSYKIVFDDDYDVIIIKGINSHNDITKLCNLLQGAYELGFLYGINSDAIMPV